MIYIFVKNKYFILQSYLVTVYLIKNYNIQSEIIFSLHDKEFTKSDIVIPFGINESKEIFLSKIANTLVVEPKIYDLLDNKASCFVFAEVNKVPAVDTFIYNSSKSELQNFIKKNNDKPFIIKPKISLDSLNLNIIDGNTLLNDFELGNLDLNNVIVQPYLHNHKLYNLNAVCKKGKILDFFILSQNSNFNLNNMFGKSLINYRRNIILKNDSHYSRILNSAKTLIAASNYSGLIDIDFLCDKSESLFLEINPRVSGQILTVYDSKMIYIEKLLLNYILQFENKNNKKRIMARRKNTIFNFSGSGINLKYPLAYGILSFIVIIIVVIVLVYIRR